MGLNDFFTRFLGVRIVRVRHLESLGPVKSGRLARKFRDEALAAVRTMELFNGRKLTDALKRRSDAYAQEVLGDVGYAPWFYVYATMQGEFREGWLPDDFYHTVVVPKLTKGLAPITNVKSLSRILLKTEALPDIGYYIGGIFYDRDFNVVDPAAFRRMAAPYDHVFVKRDGGGRGDHISKLRPADLEKGVLAGDCVLQRPIRQHPLFEQIVAGPVATLRVTTLRRPDGGLSVRGSYLRLGRKDTGWVMSGNSLRLAVLDPDGALDAVGYDSTWRAWSAHPDTGFPFRGLRVPEFRRAAAFCLELHGRAPHMPIVGWDVAVNRDNQIELMEWNGGHCDIKFCEAVSGPHFRDMGWERFAGDGEQRSEVSRQFP